MPNPQQWQKIKEIVGAALEREPSQRSAFLDEACSRDSALRVEIDSLLSAYDNTTLLSQGSQITELTDLALPPKSIGPYQLLQKLGEGGMGQVWLAEQTSPVRRKVALKLIKTGIFDDSVLQRFQTERQSLAIMDHPAIAKVFDAGATPDGQPYFVMEFVPGLPLTEFCDQKKLKISDRLELFIHACEGVQHAHQKALIHRDLKPANILVVEVDGKPQPRIIDFGLAKSVTPFFGGDFGQTRVGAFVGTPGYMSPEQADPNSFDVDTRTDVYSLGVILYELLTGSLPFDPSIWKALRFEEMLRHLREDEPLRPSTKVSSSRDASSSLAAARGTQRNQLASLLRGDLDWITLKALDKDRNRRYGSPSDLAADLSRYLHNQPVIARPASPGYLVRKYIRRNRIAVGVTAGITAGLVLLLAGFAVLQTIQLRRTTRERDRANRIAAFMANMFSVSDPGQARGNSVTAREILDQAAKDIDTGLSKDPQLQANMMDIMGTVYDNLGLYSRAESLAQRSLEIFRKTNGPNDAVTLAAENNLANILYDEGKFPESEKLYRHAYEALRRQFGVEDLRTIQGMDNLANAIFQEGHYAESEKLYGEALDIARRVLGPEHRQTVAQMGNLANNLTSEGRYADAEVLARQVLDIRRRTLGPDHPETLRAASSLGEALLQAGNSSEAEALFRQNLELQRKVLGPEHQETLGTINDLAVTLEKQGRLAEAETLLRENLALFRKVLGPENFYTLNSMSDLASVLASQGKNSEAEKLEVDTLDLERRALGPDHPLTLRTLGNLGSTLHALGRDVNAEKETRQAIEAKRRVLGPDHPDTLLSQSSLAEILKSERRYAEAEQVAKEALESRRHVLGPDHPDTAASLYQLASLAALQGRAQEAIDLLQQAVNHGLDPAILVKIEKDTDLRSLRSDPRFTALLDSLRQHASSGKSS
jgi:serine/threonine protein kinase/Tfp pilus assembly protein PilF